MLLHVTAGRCSGLKGSEFTQRLDVDRLSSGRTPCPLHRSGCRMKALRVGLTLVRHGETEYNKAGLLQGQAVDSSLSETGRQQAAAAGSDLRDVGFSNVFSSDMRRAQQTAEKIMQQNSSCLRLQMVCDPLLKERSFGVAEGGRVEDLRQMARAAGEPFPGFTPPEGETPDQVRNLLVIHRLATRWQQTARGSLSKYSGRGGEDHLDQWSSTTGPRTGTGPWTNWYQAAKEMDLTKLCPETPLDSPT
ncbi:probable fructose-2,6-bisphosphatase TIGAR A [Poecilia reticulata]|uniref:probable fructose-2,6-bisphosphatase TIGAR A n=1 Tax=Poecilia reticulata TaxID=8081 RepID=UPI0007E9823C|nr:PREDICTED: probable fructose-2,6-bisphosphatase TIGAR A [Poecilia reticulata]